MSWSWRVARIAGIDVFIHFTFPLIIAWVAFWRYNRSGDVADAINGIGFILMLFGIVVLHELGHALAARRYGIQTRDITLLPIGGVARLERLPDDPKQELVVALAGPAVNVIISAGVLIGLIIGKRAIGPAMQSLLGEGDFISQLFWINIILAVFNLVPAFPMDGGRVLRALLAMRLDYVKATQMAAGLGQLIALGFVFLGFFSNPFLILIGMFVWMGASQEAGMVQIRSALSGIPVMRAMITDFQVLSPHETLAHALDHVLAGFQQDFPVVDEGHLVGILTRKDLMAGLGKHGTETPVSQVMQREFETTEPLAMLHASFLKLQNCNCHTLPVVQNGKLVGLVTTDNLAEVLMIEETLRHAQGFRGYAGNGRDLPLPPKEPTLAERGDVQTGRWFAG